MTATRIKMLEDGQLEGVSVVGFNGKISPAATPIRCSPVFALQRGEGWTFVTLRRDADGSVWADPWDVPFSENADDWPGEGTSVPRTDARFGWEVLVLTPVDAAQYASGIATEPLGGLRFVYQPANANRDILNAIARDRFGELQDARARADVERAALRFAAVSSDAQRLVFAAARLDAVGSSKARDFRTAFGINAASRPARLARISLDGGVPLNVRAELRRPPASQAA